MPYSLKRLSGPSREVLTADDVKTQARVFISADDAYITGVLIPSVRSATEIYLNRALLPQRWRLTLDRFPGSWPYTYGYGMVQSPRREIHIPISPLISVDNFQYPDPSTLQPTDVPPGYQLVFGEPSRLQPAYGTAWPIAAWTIGGIVLEFTAGYQDDQASPIVGTEIMPPEIKHAMLMTASHWYNNREAQEIPDGALNLLSPWRVWDFTPVADNWGRFAR